MVKIYDTDSIDEVADKIYRQFEVMSSCAIYGFVTDEKSQRLIPRGEMVIEKLRMLDEIDNMILRSDGKTQRKFKYRQNSVGGPIAHKIFTWEKRIVNNEVRYTIWRYQ